MKIGEKFIINNYEYNYWGEGESGYLRLPNLGLLPKSNFKKSIALFVNPGGYGKGTPYYNYISAIVLIIAILYLLKNVKEMGYKWEPINFGKISKSK